MADATPQLCVQDGSGDGSVSDRAGGPDLVTEANAARPAVGEVGDRDWVDDLFEDLQSSDGPPVVPETQECPDKGPEVFGFFDEGSPGSTSTAPGESAGQGKDSLEDWYMLGNEDAKDMLPQHAHGEVGAAAPSGGSTGRNPSLWHSASALGRKASKFGNQARKALVEEAKLVVEDVKELSSGVREGVQLTKQDAKKIGDQLKHGAKQRGWLGGVLTGGSKKSGGLQVNAEGSSSAASPRDDALLQPGTTGDFAVVEDTTGGGARGTGSEALKVFKQGLMATAEVSKDVWRDVREVNHDAVKDLRHKVSELRHAWRDSATASSSSSTTLPGSEASGAASRTEASGDGDHGVVLVELVTSPLEALDTMLAAGVPEEGPDVAAHQPPDSRTGPERKYDEQASRATERVWSVAHVTAQASKDLWRRTAELTHGLRGLGHVQQPQQGAEEGFLADGAFWVLPSTRANYAQLELPLPSAPEAATVPAEAATVEGTATPAAAAVHMRVKKLGNRIARQTVGFVQHAKDLGQSLAATGSAAAADEAGKEACDGDSIFEIGSGDEGGGLSDEDMETLDPASVQPRSPRPGAPKSDGGGLCTVATDIAP